MTKNQAAIRDLFKIGRDTTGNLPPLPAIFPDQMAPVVRPAAVSGHHDEHPQHQFAALAAMARG